MDLPSFDVWVRRLEMDPRFNAVLPDLRSLLQANRLWNGKFLGLLPMFPRREDLSQFLSGADCDASPMMFYAMVTAVMLSLPEIYAANCDGSPSSTRYGMLGLDESAGNRFCRERNRSSGDTAGPSSSCSIFHNNQQQQEEVTSNASNTPTPSLATAFFRTGAPIPLDLDGFQMPRQLSGLNQQGDDHNDDIARFSALGNNSGGRHELGLVDVKNEHDIPASVGFSSSMMDFSGSHAIDTLSSLLGHPDSRAKSWSNGKNRQHQHSNRKRAKPTLHPSIAKRSLVNNTQFGSTPAGTSSSWNQMVTVADLSVAGNSATEPRSTSSGVRRKQCLPAPPPGPDGRRRCIKCSSRVHYDSFNQKFRCSQTRCRQWYGGRPADALPLDGQANSSLLDHHNDSSAIVPLPTEPIHSSDDDRVTRDADDDSTGRHRGITDDDDPIGRIDVRVDREEDKEGVNI